MTAKNFIPRVKDFLKKHRADLVLVLSLVFIAVVSLVLMLALRADGERVEVEIDGAVVASYPLDTDGEYPIEDGNILTVKDGKAYMSWADCPDKTCVRSHAVSKSGESIICLPNRVTVRVTGGESGPDLVS